MTSIYFVLKIWFLELQTCAHFRRSFFLSLFQAIERYLAREFGLLGKSNLETAQIEQLSEQLVDIVAALYAFFFLQIFDLKRNFSQVLSVRVSR